MLYPLSYWTIFNLVSFTCDPPGLKTGMLYPLSYWTGNSRQM